MLGGFPGCSVTEPARCGAQAWHPRLPPSVTPQEVRRETFADVGRTIVLPLKRKRKEKRVANPYRGQITNPMP